ncbi:NUDIX hydrolase [Rugosimonospora acidiphila]|uniref:NUDIX hydrolase n=1 Tax=Rugosimonospora acidiphila TaxID=556531 RepID=A0ABP9S6Z6_9ACTN
MSDAPIRATEAQSDHPVRARHDRFRGHVFSVVTDEVRMPGGEYVSRDYVVHVGAVGVVAIDDDERVVLVQQYRHPVGQRLWELPAGLMDVEGEDLVAAAARELAEEADLSARRWEMLVDVHTTPGASTEVIRLFLARELSPLATELRFRREHEEAELVTRMVPLDEAVSMALNGEITNAAALVGLLATARLRDQGWPAGQPLDTPLPRPPIAPVITV